MSNDPTEAALLKQAVLQQRLRKRMASYREGQRDAGIPVADRTQPLPLSLAQQRLWFLHQLDRAASVAYHMPAALRLLGKLDVAAVQATLDRLIARHESQRTYFVDREGVPYQQMAPADCGFALRHEDLSALPAEERDAAVAALTTEEANAPFDLAHGPLIRARLLRLAGQEHVLLITQHHIVSDGWSLSVLVREVGALYTAFCRGEGDPLPPLEIQYADYAQWQRQRLQGEELARQLEFWKSHLTGAPALLSLPLDRPRPAVQSHAGDSVPLTLSAELTARLRALSQRHGATMFVTLLSAWGVLLSRLSGQNEVVIGTPVANRQRREVEDLIGFFVNTLALRLRMGEEDGGQPSVSSLIEQMKETTLAAFAHQDLPFEQVVETVQPQRSLSYNPITQASFTWHNQPPVGELALPDLNLVVMESGYEGTQADLSLHLIDGDGVLTGRCVYATTLFDRQTIERWAGYFVRLLEAMVAEPSATVDTLPLLADSERRQLLHGFNATEKAYPQDKLLHELFEEQAAARPDALAVLFEEQSLTYGELNARANQLAHYLIGLGIQPDDRVAICVERGVELVVGMLGILKAGGAYLPLDPAYPVDRLQYMLQDAAPKALLTQSDLEDHLSVDDLPVVRLDVDLPVLARRLPVHNPNAPVRPGHLAYVIYTSGSTGLPKGVMIEHGGLANLAHAQGQLFGVEAQSRVLQFASAGFDASVSELAMTLSRGACLCLASRSDLMPGEPLQTTLRERAITHVTLPAAAVATFGEAELPALQTLIVAGDVCPPAVAQRWHTRVRFFNAYGPTETTVCATAQTCETSYENTVPIGGPIANMRVYILDERGEPVPVGVEGEIHIAGVGVARGYLNRPELTAERFVRDPFPSTSLRAGSAIPDTRMYKTGDRGRWLPDGTIEYLGRGDFQVKIRGFRIELGEIEATLARCAGVREAAVVAREDAPGDKRLVAYLVAEDGVTLHVAELRAELLAQLPEYMVPAAFVVLEALPLTTNGKLDRKALPAPDMTALVAREYEAPQGEIEETLASIWRELLRLDPTGRNGIRVGRHDEFFELGGHSLLAVQLISRIRAALGVDIALRDLFARPSLEAVAETVRQAGASAMGRIEIADREQHLPLSLAQQRLWFIDQLDPAASAAYHIPAALRLVGRLDVTALQATLNHIVARHESLRTSFPSTEGVPYQQIAPAGSGFALTERDLSVLDDESRDRRAGELAVAEARTPFDLSAGPLIRGQLLKLADEEHVLLITQHHIVTDAWSLNVLVRELAALYTAFNRGEDDPLPPLEIQYADYAQWQRHWLQGEELTRQFAFWKDHLTGAPTLLNLPLDRPRPAVESHAGGTVPLALSPELTNSLRAFSQRHGVTLFMTLLSGWGLLLSRLSSQQDVVVGTPVANRQRREVENLIGFFVNTLALRLRFDGQPSVEALLAQVKETTLAAFAHQELPFEQVVDAVQPQRTLSHSPLFQTLLALNNTAADGLALRLPELDLIPVEHELTTAQYELSLHLDDGSDALSGTFVYATDLFDRSTIERWAGYYVRLLDAMVADATASVETLPLLSASERQQLLGNVHPVDYPQDRLIHESFEQQAAARPEAVAVVYEEQILTYGELNARANRVAHELIALGVQPDDRVAICVERSPEMIVGLLGILKAGGAYVPLDPAYPIERLRYMLEDSAPVALLTQSGLQGLDVNPGSDVPVIDISAAQFANRPDRNPERGLAPHNLGYIIYTSGSTGTPKGVMVEHRNVIRLFSATEPWFHFDESDVWTMFHSYAFDFSVWEIWGALLYGGQLVVVPQDITRSPGEFYKLVCRTGTTVLNQTPSAFRQFIAAQGASGEEHRLRHVIFGGEALEMATVEPWFERNGDQQPRLVNMYGITETTVHVTYRPIDRADVERGGSPIGGPIPDLLVYVLDAHREPVPLGVVGELYVGGAGVARGYLNRPELTAERFVADPFAGRQEARMYKSGDLGRRLPDGSIDFIGRNDAQVKIRGFRIELGEIEAKLGHCARVREAVVMAREDVAGDKRLVAYLVAEDGVTLQGAELRTALLSQLPEYMVPAAFVQLDGMPLTTNGKLDRNALPAPESSAVVTREYEPPQGEVETAVAALWQEMLNIPRVGRHDQFFELGGHSLLVVAMVERLRTHGLSGEVRAIFTAPTLCEYAATLGRDAAADATDTPPNAITPETVEITPELLPLVALTQLEIDRIVAAVPGGVANIQDIYPLLALQEGMLFHHLLDTEGDTYLSREMLAFASRSHLDRFLGVLEQVIARHDILRTGVIWEGMSKPVQVVYRNVTLPLEIVAVSGERDALDVLREHTDPQNLRLDVRHAPMLAAYAAEDVQSGEWLLSLLVHHLICDHVTMELVLGEVRTLLRGEGERLAAPVPFRNLVAQVGKVPLSGHETYFREQLGDVDAPTAPFGILDVQVKSTDLRTAKSRLDDALARQVRDCAGRLGVTPAVLFHVAWAQVLARCTGRTDVVFGTVLSGRLQGAAGADRALGMLINTLPLRVSLDADARQVVRQSYERMVGLLAHEQAPLTLAQRCSGVAAPMPLFTTSLNYRHSAHAEGEDAETIWRKDGLRSISGARDFANFPIGVKVDDFGQDFALTALCTREVEVERIPAYLATALATLVHALNTADDKPLSRMDILPADERAELLHAFNATDTEFPKDLIHELFEQQAAVRADAVAVTFEDQSLSYAELNTRANQLAHYLISLGVKPDSRVAVCVDRSLEMIVGMLGILKAGGAYLPLDPAYPAERLQYMLQDAAPAVLLTQSETEAELPDTGIPVLRLDVDLAVLARRQPTHNPDARALGLTSNNLAYVIYTSGSTGLPKGVMVEHGGFANLAHAQAGLFGVDAESRVLQFASAAFDASVWEVAMTLPRGARLCMAPRHALMPGEPLRTTLRELAITHATLPSTALSACGEAELPALRSLVVAGDVCPPALVQRWYDKLQFVNAYGPTESTVCATAQVCGEPYPTTVPIGPPIANMRIYILDAHGEPAPVGVEGEIHIGGAGIARGYLNRPELTAERFLRDPFPSTSLRAGSNAPQARMYKTGDRGRWLPDGTVEYLGRTDFQVKIRGFRIELGEIEAKLGACAGVRETMVIAREDIPGDKRLVAYLVAEDSVTLQVAELRAALSAQLPEYMVPSAFVQLTAMPLTSNGKVDRKALPAPEAGALSVQEYVPPQGEIEQSLASIWEELLKVPRVGRNDNFFELGGHSLLVVSLIERLRDRGLSLPLGDVFKQPTLMELASRIAATEDDAQSESELAHDPIPYGTTQITPEMLPLATLEQSEIDAIVASVPGGIGNVQDIYALSPLQEGFLFHHLIQEEGDPYVSRMVLSFDTPERLDVFVNALQKVVNRHDALRTAFRWQGLDRPVQVVQRYAPLTVKEIETAGEALAGLYDATTADLCRLDPQQAPLLAAFAAREKDGGPCYLALLYHHLISDHQSMELLVNEANAFLTGQEAQLLPPLAYRRFIAQSQQLSAQEHETWFRDLLGDVVEPTVPFGVLETHGTGFEVGRTYGAITGELAERIRNAARRERMSPAALFHAAWALVVGRLSGSDDVVFGSVLSGRQGIRGAERAVGMFINTLPLRLRLSGLGVQQAIRDTAGLLAELLEHEQAPLAWAQRASGVRPPLPLFTALMNYTHNTHVTAEEEEARRATGVEMVRSETHNNYPLTMTVGDDTAGDFGLVALTAPGIDGKLLCECLESVLSGLVDKLERDPECAFESLTVLSPEAESALLRQARGTAGEQDREQMLPEAISRQAVRTPDAVALRGGDVALSYRELESRTNRLAQLLVEQGIERGSRVGVHLGRSIELLIAQIAIMKTGAAYVPLDPTQAPERLAAMVRDAEIAVVLLDSRTMRLPVLGVDTVFVDGAATERDWLSDYPDETPAVELHADDTIYVLYTSGSTGEPKGVEVRHGGVIDYCAFARNNYYGEQLQGSLVATSPAFDLTLPSLYVPLLAGGCVELLPEQDELEALSGWLASDSAAVLLRLTPSHVQALLTLSDDAPRQSAHVFVIGGEVFEPAVARRLQAKFLGARIYNHYGPTETVVGCAWFDVTANLDSLTERIPIGRPMENTSLYVLDAKGRLQPAGVPGELYIGGAGVAKGYLNRPQLTAEKFVAGPFGDESRVYRSGDRVRWTAGGQLEFLGRTDRQVKLRGYRIELGEIENRLKQSAHVRDAVVRLWDEQLVAYVVAVAAAQGTQEERQNALQAQLSSQLPQYMLPAAYVWVDVLPLTVNGKVDVQALPAPDATALRTHEYEAPAGEIEETLAAIWQDLLKLPRAGRRDNFQLLGGHSLLMMQLVVRVRERFNVELPLRRIFEAPMLCELADLIVTAQLGRFAASDIAEAGMDLSNLSEEELLSMLANAAQ
jgi:amino acid adenylation domain-containing protein